jgi:hypothetical protein
MNLRELVHLISTTLQVLGVERHAARLMRAGYLPRSSDTADEDDAALLLLAVMAAPDPSDAVEVVDRLSRLPLVTLRHRTLGGGVLPFEEWSDTAISDDPPTFPDLVAGEILSGSSGAISPPAASLSLESVATLLDLERGQ